MKYVCTLLAVTDMERSKRFYKDVLGLNVLADFGANVTLEGCITLQTAESWREFLGGRQADLPHHAGELYFEERDLDSFLVRLEQQGVSCVHAPLEHRWASGWCGSTTPMATSSR